MYWLVFSMVIVLVISLAIHIVCLFRFIWKDKTSHSRGIAQNISLSLFSFLFIVILLEIYFKLFFIQSDGFGFTLASINWTERYWQNNSLEYRDIEWTPELLEGRTKIMVVGDSFVAGAGINDPADRFPDLLGQMLGQDYAVMNVGVSGASTKDEIRNALKYPHQPDIVILSFHVSDIDDTANDMGFTRPPVQVNSPALVEASYALNFLYWRLFRWWRYEIADNYWTWLFDVYDNPEIWTVYQSELLQFHHLTKEKNIQLIVVLFPHLLSVEQQRPIIKQVANVFIEQEVPILDVTELVEGMEPDALIVNEVDSHPNESVHRLVAEELYQIVLDTQQITAQ